jgi:hypothetical protein
MAVHKIILDGLREFGAEVIAAGRYSSVRGHPTEAAAREWLAEQRAIEAEIGAPGEEIPEGTPG